MASRRGAGKAPDSRFYEPASAWATDADHALIAAAGTSPRALSAAIYSPGQEIRFHTIPEAERADWALTLIGAGRRRKAISDWARANRVRVDAAHAYFEPRV